MVMMGTTVGLVICRSGGGSRVGSRGAGGGNDQHHHAESHRNCPCKFPTDPIAPQPRRLVAARWSKGYSGLLKELPVLLAVIAFP